MNKPLYALISSALKNAEENGDGDKLRALSFAHQASDLHDCDADIEGYDSDAVIATVIDYRINEKPSDLPKILNRVQYEGLRHRLLEPTHAIRFALSVYEGLDFLKAWNEGDWRGCMEWTTWRLF